MSDERPARVIRDLIIDGISLSPEGLSVVGRGRIEEKTQIEDEKRIELHALPSECEGNEATEIMQGFLNECMDEAGERIADVRIRRETNARTSGEGGDKYTLTAKHRPNNLESEMSIPAVMFEALIVEAKSKQHKLRYHLESGWDVDHVLSVDGEDDNRIFAEYEKQSSGERPEIPSHWEVKKEQS